jgi:hypothetical protein
MTPDAAVREDAGLLTARFLRAVRESRPAKMR